MNAVLTCKSTNLIKGNLMSFNFLGVRERIQKADWACFSAGSTISWLKLRRTPKTLEKKLE